MMPSREELEKYIEEKFLKKKKKVPEKLAERKSFEEQSIIDNQYYDNWAREENKDNCNHLGYSVTQLGNGPWRCVNCKRPVDW